MNKSNDVDAFVTLDWLNDNLDNPDVVIVDTRAKNLYTHNHIINSISISIEQVIKLNANGAHLVLDVRDLNILFSEYGINSNKIVVICGDYLDPAMARIAWTLLYSGHQKVKILNVGITNLDKSLTSTTSSNCEIKKTSFVANVNNNLRITTNELKNQLDNFVILDARSINEYIYGHLPKSISSPFLDGIKSNSFQDKQILIKIFEDKKISSNDDIVCYCTHGHRASNLFLQLMYAGYNKIKLYDGSFVDWIGEKLNTE